MLAKREEEKSAAEKRDAAHTKWEQDKDRQATAKATAELKRKQSCQEQRVVVNARRVSWPLALQGVVCRYCCCEESN